MSDHDQSFVASDDFGDLDQFLTRKANTKPLTIHGQQFQFPGDISGEAWLILMRVISRLKEAATAEAEGREVDSSTILLTDEQEEMLTAELFGDCLPAMKAAGVTGEEIRITMSTLMLWHAEGRDAASMFWRGGGNPKAMKRAMPNRAARRSKKNSSKKGR